MYSENCAKRVHEAHSVGQPATPMVRMEHLDSLSIDIHNIQRNFARLKDMVQASTAEELALQHDNVQRPYPNSYGSSEGNGYGHESPERSPAMPSDSKKRRGVSTMIFGRSLSNEANDNTAGCPTWQMPLVQSGGNT
jgi:hypothetical protein